jgi:RNA polymerase sigma-70 factor, ECF subfamily
VDQVLIRRCQAGDEEAFRLLFEQYKNLVYRTTYLTLGTAADADDILQEVFLQVHRSLEGYDPARGAFSTWLYRITVNRCLNWRRRRSTAESLDEIAAAAEAADNRDPRADGAARREIRASHCPADRYEMDDSIRRALDRLSCKLRLVVILRHYWDLSYAEIAAIMDLPLGTVKSRLNIAMRQMRDDLESEFTCPARTVTEA